MNVQKILSVFFFHVRVQVYLILSLFTEYHTSFSPFLRFRNIALRDPELLLQIKVETADDDFLFSDIQGVDISFGFGTN